MKSFIIFSVFEGKDKNVDLWAHASLQQVLDHMGLSYVAVRGKWCGKYELSVLIPLSEFGGINTANENIDAALALATELSPRQNAYFVRHESNACETFKPYQTHDQGNYVGEWAELSSELIMMKATNAMSITEFNGRFFVAQKVS